MDNVLCEVSCGPVQLLEKGDHVLAICTCGRVGGNILREKTIPDRFPAQLNNLRHLFLSGHDTLAAESLAKGDYA